MENDEIQEKVNELHTEILANIDSLCGSYDPKIYLHPCVAAQVLGLEYEEVPSLGDWRFGFQGKMRPLAGLLDRQSNKIVVATNCLPCVTRFTGAHEIGHVILHEDEVMHRDMPIDDRELRKIEHTPIEREANKFAKFHCMPEALVKRHFQARFGTAIGEKFVFDDTSSFELARDSWEQLVRSEYGTLEREFALARATRFGGHFNSLSDAFGVSHYTMAIRIKELKLIQWP